APRWLPPRRRGAAPPAFPAGAERPRLLLIDASRDCGKELSCIPCIKEVPAMTLTNVGQLILARRQEVPSGRSVLVGITGIDGSGKGYVTERLAVALQQQGVRVAAINLDGWLTLPAQRFNPND